MDQVALTGLSGTVVSVNPITSTEVNINSSDDVKLYT